jgi:hypothetical protein
VAEPTGSRWQAVIGIAFVGVAVAVAVVGLRDQWGPIGQAVAAIGWWRVIAATALAVVGLLCTAEVWRHCLAALGFPTTRAVTHRIFFPSQIGKYLPGSVWPFLAQMRLARTHGIPASAALLAGSVFLVIHAVTSVPVGSLVLFTRPSFAGQLAIAGAGAVLGLAMLHPKVLTFGLRKLAGRSGVEARELGWADVIRPLLWMPPAWLAYGAAAFLLAAPLGVPSADLFALCTGAFAASWLVGLVAIVAPAGLGAREAVLILAFQPIMGLAGATSVALLLRLCHTAADVVLAARFGLLPETLPRTPTTQE